MKNENNQDATSEDRPQSALETVSDLVTELVTGVPAPIRKNVFKAFGQLCTAAVDIPVAYLEGVVAEKRAVTDARVQILRTSGEQIAKQLNVDPEYARSAVKRYGQKIVRERINIDKTCEIAAEEIKTKPLLESRDESKAETREISDDWLNNFETVAAQKSTDEMHLLLGRILAGEIQRPTSFSIKTVRLLENLDTQMAQLFQHLCSLSAEISAGDRFIDVRVISMGTNAAANGLGEYGLTFDKLNRLHEYGLIIPDFNSYMNFAMCVADPGRRSALGFKYQNRTWVLDSEVDRPPSQEFRVHGVGLSRSGQELFRIIDLEPFESEAVQTYTSALERFFDQNQLKMVQIPG